MAGAGETEPCSKFEIHSDDSLRFSGRWCVPTDEGLRRKILTEAHSTPYSVHSGGDKLYKDLKVKEDILVAEHEERGCRVCVSMFSMSESKRLTKSAHFIPMKDAWSKAELAKAYIRYVVMLHGVPKDIVSDRDSRADVVVLGPEMIQEMVEQVQVIRQNMRAAQDRQLSYADLKRSGITFEKGENVLLKVSPMKGVMRFGKREKLSQKYIRPFEILDRVGEVAYRLALPPSLAKVHNVFHVSQLRRYLSDPSHVLDYEAIEIDEQMSYVEMPKEILDRKVRKTRNGETALVKVLWTNHNVEEATWEAEAAMKEKFPNLFI
ncbi:uncharacterized protein LOC141651121 [Silene latifolia]|uniref:uncharacterized protein LOC141651121 n=1 Tax=Silene latifolia TaxID=37657 RepID=UPI003D77C3F4